MNLTALELVRTIVALDRFDEVDDDFIEDLQVKITEACLPKFITKDELIDDFASKEPRGKEELK